MTGSVELPAPDAGQRLLTALLRSCTRLVFALGMRPSVSPVVQRRVLRLATLVAPGARGVTIEPGRLGAVPCEWLRPARDNGWVLLALVMALLWLLGSGWLCWTLLRWPAQSLRRSPLLRVACIASAMVWGGFALYGAKKAGRNCVRVHGSGRGAVRMAGHSR